MRQPRVVEILKRISPAQMQRLGDFIASPYFNKDADLTELFDYLLMLYPRYEPKATTRKAILQRVSAIKTENELLKKLTRLHELVRQFLALELCLHEHEQRLRLLRAYKQLGMDSEAVALERQLRKELAEVAFRDETYWERLYHLEEATMECLNHRLQRNAANQLDSAMDALTHFYMTKKIGYLNEAANRERLVGIPLQEAAKQEALRFLQAADEDDPYLYIYAHLFQLNTTRDPEKALGYYRKVKDAVARYEKHIIPKYLRIYYEYLQNYCIVQMNREQHAFFEEFLDIIRKRMDKNLLLVNGRISPILYKNVVVVAIQLNRLEWAAQFAETYRPHLPPAQRDDYYHLTMAELCYAHRDFTAASRHLMQASHNRTDAYFGFAVRELMLKIAFESDEPAVDACIDMFRKHLERHRRQIGERALLFKKFLDYFRLLHRARHDRAALEVLLGRLLEEEKFPSRKWLLAMTRQHLGQAPRVA